jgi:hypothetical protein
MTGPARAATPPAGQERPQPSKPVTLRAKLWPSGFPALPPTPWHNSGRHPTSAGRGSAAEAITSPEHRNGPEAKADRVRELRAVLADCHDRPTRAHDNTIPPRQYHCGRRSRGRAWLTVEVQAFCECGWATPWQLWATPPDAAAKASTRTKTALDEHQAFTTHRRFPNDRWPEPDGYHHRCGWFHDFQDVCPAPPTSTTGRVNRVSGGSSLGDRTATLDQLAAIHELRDWLDEQEAHGVIRARLAGFAWADIAVVTATTTGDAYNRWAPLIHRYEAAGLLKPTPAEENRRSR